MHRATCAHQLDESTGVTGDDNQQHQHVRHHHHFHSMSSIPFVMMMLFDTLANKFEIVNIRFTLDRQRSVLSIMVQTKKEKKKTVRFIVT